MKRIKFVIAGMLAVVGALALAGVGSAQVNPADLDTSTQRTSWGLDTFGTSRSIGDFSSLGWTLEEADGNVFVGGNFLNVTNGQLTESQPYFAAFDLRTGVWEDSITPAVGGPVLALMNAPDGGMFVAGEVDTWNGQQVGSLLKIDPATGDQDQSFQGRVFGGNATVRDLFISDDGWLYVGGSFDTANDGGAPLAVNGVVRFDLDTGALDRSWIPDTSALRSVWGIAESYVNDNVYIAGWSEDIGQGQSTDPAVNKGLITVSVNDASVETWDGFAVNKTATNMYDVETTPWGTVFIGGTEHGLYVHDENNNMALINNHVTNRNQDLQEILVRSGGDYQDIEVVGDKVYATCHCWGSHASKSTLIDYTPAWDLSLIDATHTGFVSGVIAYDATSGDRDQTFDPYMAGDVGGWGTLAASDGCLWTTGGFNAVGQPGAQSPGRDLVRFCPEDGGSVTIQPVASCEALVSGETVTVNWDASANAEDYVISRAVDGGGVFWRGVSDTTSFTDTNRDGEMVYSVVSRSGNDKSVATTCTTTIEEPPPADTPTNCGFAISGNDITVSWTPAADAVRHVVYRSVDGGNQFWRGAVEDVDTFSDTMRGDSVEYFVLASFADGSRSERVQCTQGPDGPPPPPDVVTPISSCSVTVDGDLATVTWDQVADAGAEYIVSRSVDGGNIWWRGKASGTTFSDSLRSGSIEYFVATKVGNTRADEVACTPVVQF